MLTLLTNYSVESEFTGGNEQEIGGFAAGCWWFGRIATRPAPTCAQRHDEQKTGWEIQIN